MHENPLHSAARREIDCPTCGVWAGQACVTALGTMAQRPHSARLFAAYERATRP